MLKPPPSRRLLTAIVLLLAFATSSALGAPRLRGERKHAAHHASSRRPLGRRGSRRPGGSSTGGGHSDGSSGSGASAAVKAAATTGTVGTATATTLLGDEALESQRDYLDAGEAEAFSFAARAAGATGAAHVYIDAHNAATGVVVGVYSSAGKHPGTLLASGAISAPKAQAWDTVPLTSAQLTSGSTYWLAILGTGGTLRYRDRGQGPCPSESSAQEGLGALPASWRTGTVYRDCPVSGYITAGAPSFPAEEPKSPLDPPPPTEPPATSEPPPVQPPPPPPAAPSNSALPTVTGTTTENQTLSATTGTWSGSPTSYAYQWQDCNALGEACLSIASATTSRYTLTAADVGHTVRAVVTAANAGGSTSASSAATATIAADPPPPPPPPPPVETTPPPVEGGLYISPTGSDSNPCTLAKPCLTMGHAYEKAAPGETVQMLAGSYPGQTLNGQSSKTSGSHVVFMPAAGADVTVTGTIYVLASHLTIEGIAVQDVTIGNYDQTPGWPNPTDVTLLDLIGRNFEIDSATHITVEGGSWGPASACGGPYGGGNNSIRQPISSQAPEDIVINDTIIHEVQSYNLVGCHIEGLAIFAGNHVTVSNSKFYGNSVYDVFMQANSGGNPDNITLAHNWFAEAVDDSGANGRAVGSGNGVAVGNELSANVTLEANHFNDVLNMNDAGDISRFTNVHVLDNVGIQAYNNYPCGSLSGIEWSKNIWQNDKCSASDADLDGAALPYVNASNGSAMNYTLTGTYAGWPEEAKEEAKKEEPAKEEVKKEEPKQEEPKKEEPGSAAGTLYLSPSGSDSAACTQSAPCKTLAHAYSVAKAGEKVVLAAGTYTDTSLPLTSGKTAADPVVFEPANGAAVKFSKEVRAEAHGAELKGFKFEKPLYFGENAEGDTSRDNALHNFEIVSGGTKAPKDISIIGGTAGPVADAGDNENNLIATNGPETTAVPTKITVEGVLIHEYTKVGEAHVDCLQIWGGNEITIQDNTFKKCSVFDIFLQALPNGDAGTPKNVTIQNNFLEKTIEGYFSIFLPHHNEGNSEHYENIDIRNNSATQTIAADPRATYTNVQFDGNIAPSLLFWNEATEVDQGVPSGAEAEYNVWYEGGAKKYGTHDQLAAAGFVDEATLDLELTAGAAALEHGDPGNYPATDINGHTRPDPPDAGAAQYTG
jgi:hypothetical protein